MTILLQDDPTVKTLVLPSGHTVLIDEGDYLNISAYAWCLSGAGYVKARVPRYGGKHIYLHRFLMDAPTGMYVDHVNRNPLDCRRINLRICTAAENAKNRGAQRNTTSKYKGVSWAKATNRWMACIRGCGQNINLGYFTSEVEAARAYNSAARLYHGEFALLNEVD